MKLFYTFLVLIIVGISLSSCSKKYRLRVGERPTIPQTQDSIDIHLSDNDEVKVIKPIERKFIITIVEKEKCYQGGCPSYLFSLHNDGVAFYSCYDSCYPRKGQYYAYIGKDKAKSIVSYIEHYKLMNLNSLYPENGKPVQHIPATKFTLALDGAKEKKITSYHHAPKALLELEKMIEELIESTEWKLTYE